MPKTIVLQKDLFEKRNVTDVFNRLVIMGLLRVFNKQIRYTQIWEDTDEMTETITVPFFYDFAGAGATSERFIQDNYTFFTSDECTSMGIKKMDGNYDALPLGRISLGSVNIDSGNISNRFVMGRYLKRENGNLQSYVSFLYSIPLSYSFSVKIRCDTMNTAWKIEQAYREVFYKNKTFHINYKGNVVPVRVGFPESLPIERAAEYTFGQLNEKSDVTISFDIACETYLPVFDPYNERKADNYIRNFVAGIGVNDFMRNEEGNILAVNDLSGKTLVSGQDIMLLWHYYYDIGDMLMVEIGYEDEDGQINIIETLDNNNFYHWEIPSDFVLNILSIDIAIPNTEYYKVILPPVIKIWPDLETNVVSPENVYVYDKGFIITAENVESISGILLYKDNKDKIKEVELTLNLINNMVDEMNPVLFKKFIYKKEMNYKKIRLFVRDHYNTKKISYFCSEDSWITII